MNKDELKLTLRWIITLQKEIAERQREISGLLMELPTYKTILRYGNKPKIRKKNGMCKKCGIFITRAFKDYQSKKNPNLCYSCDK